MVNTARTRRPRRKSRLHEVHKPHGALHHRVKSTTPERFGIVSVDCAKVRSKWMLCDFYGRVLLPPRVVAHTKCDLENAVFLLRQSIETHRLEDLVVAVERTGRYHLPVKRTFTTAGFEVRVVHPFATKQFRQPANPGNKTDDTDLSAIHRATVNGFGLMEQEPDPTFRQLMLLARHRRNLVQKSSALCCQIREHLEAAMPGFANCFDDVWRNRAALPIARRTASAEVLRKVGIDLLVKQLRETGIQFHRRTVERAVAWAHTACQNDSDAKLHYRIWTALDDDRLEKARQIQALERDLAAILVQTSYVLLLSIPGINVVSAADLAGEMGPIAHYANHRAITGRAGLFPARRQSDQVDRCNGPLVRCANRRLRAVLLGIADNLLRCNSHFRSKGELWKAVGKDPRHSHVKVASRFCRIAYHMVAGGQVFQHPFCRERSYILDKLLAFHREHNTEPLQILADLKAATAQIPSNEYRAEAEPLIQCLRPTQTARRRGPQPIGDMLVLVLAKLGVDQVEFNPSGDQDLS